MAPGKVVRFGLIGCGEIAVRSGAAIAAIPDVAKIAAVQDINEAMAKDAGEKFGAPHHTDAEALLARGDVDAVVISTPHFLHEPLATQAAKAGKHVACEKPIACTVDQADRMIAACRKARVLLGINYVLRYDSDVKKAAELLKAGAIGKLLRYQCNVMADKPESYWSGGWTGRVKTDWRQSKEKSGGGVLIMNAIHDLDRVLWFTGLKPLRAYAESDTHATPVEVEDNLAAVVRFEGGAIGSVDVMSCARGRESFGNRLYGSEGQIVLGNPLRVFTTKDGIPGLKKDAWTEIPLEKLKGDDTRRAYFADFAAAVRDGKPEAPVSGEAARLSLALCAAIYESAERKAPVDVW